MGAARVIGASPNGLCGLALEVRHHCFIHGRGQGIKYQLQCLGPTGFGLPARFSRLFIKVPPLHLKERLQVGVLGEEARHRLALRRREGTRRRAARPGIGRRRAAGCNLRHHALFMSMLAPVMPATGLLRRLAEIELVRRLARQRHHQPRVERVELVPSELQTAAQPR